jgi:hypothetical protein
VTNQAYSVSVASLVVATAVTGSGTIKYENARSGVVYVPAGSSLTSLTWHASLAEEGPYMAADNEAGAAIVQTVAAGQAHPIPAAMQGAMFLRVTGDVAGEIGYTLKD